MSARAGTAGAAAGNASPAGRERNRGLVVAVLLTGAFMILLDATIVNVAIPAIQRNLGASYGAIQWLVSGYALAYGLLLVPAGRLGDRFGHKRLFMLGLAGFTAASVLCGTAQSAGHLVAWRVLQGVAAGVLNPPILALIQTLYPPRERGKAFVWYGAVAGLATAAGPVLGGLLIAWDLAGWDWRPIFLLNLPVGALALAAARLLPSARGRAGGLDPVGIVLVSVALLLVTYPLVQGPAAGWPAWSFASLAAAVPALAAFAAWEAWWARRGRAPLVDLRLFANRAFSAGVGVSLCFFAGFISLLFVLSLHLQLGLGRSALDAGLTLMPFAAGVFLSPAAARPLAGRLGRRLLHLGAALVIAGVAGLIATVRAAGVDVPALALLPSLLVTGIGSGLVIASNVDIVLAGVPRQEAGAASGVLNSAQRIGQALGIAVVGVVLFGALGSGADRAAATTTTPRLRERLAAAGLSGPAAGAAIDRFGRCFHDRANATDPSVNPPGCPSGEPGDPVGDAFAAAAGAALAENFTRAVQLAAATALGAVVLTFLLVFLLPKAPPRAQAEPPRAAAGPLAARNARRG